ncbi:MAG: ABC transporter substrate-binding protein [Rhodobacteraceae bacterium]|nr:ABC transporter substrate-binding protein [Paracoccaceae bacterium]MAY46555.1 ABC transporter substrate-binding protein [Paracoccaceae bacterium]
MIIKTALAAGFAAVALSASGLGATELNIVHGAVGKDQEVLRAALDRYEAETGNTVNIVSMPERTTDQFAQFKLWLSAGSSDIDVYRLDVIWAPQLADHFIDLTDATADIIDQFVPAAVASQTVDGKLVALPMFLGAPALYYRADLLETYGKAVPTTWTEMTETARQIMDAEREAGNSDMWGYVFQGAAYEGLTCNAMEWIASNGGGHVVEPDGAISVMNDKAVEALELAASWPGTISPPGVLNYAEEDARGVFQSGNAVFMRNWNYAYALVTGDDSPIKDVVDVTTLPAGDSGDGASILGGSHLGVAKYSKHQDEAIELVRFLNNEESQRARAIQSSRPPTLKALYEDPEIAETQPFIPLWKPVIDNAIVRPAAPTKTDYNEVSSEVWTAAHDVMAGQMDAQSAIGRLNAKLSRLKGSNW